jgi:hypothetical protein
MVGLWSCVARGGRYRLFRANERRRCKCASLCSPHGVYQDLAGPAAWRRICVLWRHTVLKACRSVAREDALSTLIHISGAIAMASGLELLNKHIVPVSIFIACILSLVFELTVVGGLSTQDR